MGATPRAASTGGSEIASAPRGAAGDGFGDATPDSDKTEGGTEYDDVATPFSGTASGGGGGNHSEDGDFPNDAPPRAADNGDLSLRGTQYGGGDADAADADSAGGLVRARSGRQRRPKLFFHDDWRASADDAELRAAAATSATVDGRRTAHRGGRGCGGSQ